MLKEVFSYIGLCGLWVDTIEYALAARVLKLKIHISLFAVPLN
jgi:hypothetical protein